MSKKQVEIQGMEAGVDSQGQACRLFTVAQGVRWMNTVQLETLGRSFESWVRESRDRRTRRSRERVMLIFLLLRYTGARLGEVLALDERRHFDYSRLSVVVGEGEGSEPGGPRDVPLPSFVLDRIREYCMHHENGLATSHGRLFDLDQGFVRRKFSEQEERSGLSRELLNPRVVRNSRAIELLRGGLPLRAVQALLGHSRTDFTASFISLADKDIRYIIQQYLRREYGQETSARNVFQGEIVRVAERGVACDVVLRTASGLEVAAVVTRGSCRSLNLLEGRRATAMVKATLAALDLPGSDWDAVRNRTNGFRGHATDITTDGRETEVNGILEDGTPVCALVEIHEPGSPLLDKGEPFLFTFSDRSVIVS